MNTKENKIKTLLNELFNISKKETFLDVTTQDGSTLRTPDDLLKVGSQVTLVSADGSETPVTDGDYTLEDGSTASVKSGVIESLTPAASAPAPAPADATTAPDGTSMSAPQVDAPVDGVIAPQADASDAPSAPAMDSDDMSKLLEIVKNITDRLSALEEKVGETKMAVQKMAAAPAAVAFNKVSKPTSAEDYFKEFQRNARERKEAKAKRTQEIMLGVAETRQVEEPMKFASMPKAPKSAPIKTNNKKIDLGMNFNGSAVSNK